MLQKRFWIWVGVSAIALASAAKAAEPAKATPPLLADRIGLTPNGVIRASTATDGVQTSAVSYQPKFLPNSGKLVFTSYADTLSLSDANGTQRDVFLKDLETGDTTLVSADDFGNGGDGESHSPVVSPNGTKIGFASRAGNLGFTVPAGVLQVYMRDVADGTVSLVSTNQSGDPSDGDVAPAGEISTDDNRVAFYGRATNLGSAEGVRDNYDVFVKDLTTQVVRIASRTKGDVLGPAGEFWPTLAPDGLSVAYYGNSANLVPDPPQNGENIYLKDLKKQFVSRLSVTPDGLSPNGRSYFPLFAPTGKRLAFMSDSNEIAPVDDFNGTWDVFDVDMSSSTKKNRLMSQSEEGVARDAESTSPAYSRDGTRIAFFSAATNLIDSSPESDTNFDLFIKSIGSGKVQRIRLGELGTTEGGGLRTMGDADIGSDWNPPTFSSDGSVIAFATDASLTVADTNGKRDVYVARVTGNDAPEFNTTTVEDTIDEDTTYDDFDLTEKVDDLDGDTITFSVLQQPAHGTVSIDKDVGTLTYTPNKDY